MSTRSTPLTLLACAAFIVEPAFGGDSVIDRVVLIRATSNHLYQLNPDGVMRLVDVKATLDRDPANQTPLEQNLGSLTLDVSPNLGENAISVSPNHSIVNSNVAQAGPNQEQTPASTSQTQNTSRQVRALEQAMRKAVRDANSADLIGKIMDGRSFPNAAALDLSSMPSLDQLFEQLARHYLGEFQNRQMASQALGVTQQLLNKRNLARRGSDRSFPIVPLTGIAEHFVGHPWGIVKIGYLIFIAKRTREITQLSDLAQTEGFDRTIEILRHGGQALQFHKLRRQVLQALDLQPSDSSDGKPSGQGLDTGSNQMNSNEIVTEAHGTSPDFSKFPTLRELGRLLLLHAFHQLGTILQATQSVGLSPGQWEHRGLPKLQDIPPPAPLSRIAEQFVGRPWSQVREAYFKQILEMTGNDPERTRVILGAEIKYFARLLHEVAPGLKWKSKDNKNGGMTEKTNAKSTTIEARRMRSVNQQLAEVPDRTERGNVKAQRGRAIEVRELLHRYPDRVPEVIAFVNKRYTNPEDRLTLFEADTILLQPGRTRWDRYIPIVLKNGFTLLILEPGTRWDHYERARLVAVLRANNGFVDKARRALGIRMSVQQFMDKLKFYHIDVEGEKSVSPKPAVQPPPRFPADPARPSHSL